MSFEYYQHVRSEIEPLLPDAAANILEVGCGAGPTLRWLKGKYPEARTTGVDGNAAIKDQLSTNADTALIADLDQPLVLSERYDLILALDVLEHLKSAEAVLERLTAALSEGGVLIVSLPNVSHLSVSLPLVFARRFAYADAGILDRTHIRFFVESSAIELMNAAGLEVVGGLVNGLHSVRTRLFDALTLGLLRHYFTKQYIMRVRRAGGPVVQRPVKWEISHLISQPPG